MRVLFLLGLICAAVSADTLKLRDGRILSGQFLGATRAEIWFQRDVPGEVLGKEAFPVMQVESLVLSLLIASVHTGLAVARVMRI